MSNDSMGNLEKLGILVIVILVVVVGVVAITPSDTLFPKDGGTSVAGGGEESLEQDVPELDLRDQRDDWSARRDPADHSGASRLAPWPIPEEDQLGGESSKESNFEAHELDHEIVVLDPPTDVPLPPVDEPVVIETLKPKPIAPAYRTVKIKSGDTLIGIAQRELGDGQRYREIMALNPDIDPRRMRAGIDIRVPTGAAPARGGSAKPQNGPQRDATGEQKYVVKAGQTAGEISTAVYGTSKHWKLILDHNGIDDPRSVRAGATLRIPPLRRTSANLPPAGSTPASTGGTRSTGARAVGSSSERTHVVEPGETPGQIAKEQLGDFSRWRELLEFNGIEDEQGLLAGATIRLPR